VGTNLSKATIVQAALDVLNEMGMDGVTVRAVAGRLGVQAPALYWHFKGKQELVDEMATEIWRRLSSELLELEPQLAWRKQLIAFATIVRRTLLSHRDGARIFSGTYLTDVSVLQRQEATFARMIEAGFTLENTVRAYKLLYCFTVGFCIEEQAVSTALKAGDDRYSLVKRAERLDSQAFPLALESGSYIFGDPNEQFKDLVNLLVDAIARTRVRRLTER
jgi:TetR/AcrR family transcriptional regulator, tetracycline repressor protein